MKNLSLLKNLRKTNEKPVTPEKPEKLVTPEKPVKNLKKNSEKPEIAEKPEKNQKKLKCHIKLHKVITQFRHISAGMPHLTAKSYQPIQTHFSAVRAD